MIVLTFLSEIVSHFYPQSNAATFKKYLFISVFVEGNISLTFRESNAINVKPYHLEISTTQILIKIEKKIVQIKVKILQ